MDSTESTIELTVRAGDHSALIIWVTVVENGQADEPIGIDVLVSGNVADEHDFG